MSAVTKYIHKRLNGVEFEALRRKARVQIRDFMFLSGRHSRIVGEFRGDDPKKANQPTMADVMILEMIKRHPESYDQMMEIANEYSLGPTLTREAGGK